MSRVVILYGPPGGGKGTQANLLAHLRGFYHLDTGQYIEGLVHDPNLRGDKIIQRERELFDSGKLCTPSWVLDMVKKKVVALRKADLKIVFSGSPRTYFEAFGDAETEGLAPFLEKLYGFENIFIFLLTIRPETTLRRNSSRIVCSLCGQPLIYMEVKVPHCPFCGGDLRTRTLDKPEVIKTRLEEYKNRTSPMFDQFIKNGYKIHEIDGEPKPEIVFNNIIKYL